MAYSGTFKPKNWQKYKGNIDKIRYLSLWELRCFHYLDNKKEIIKWSSESGKCQIRYHNPTKKSGGLNSTYLCDIWMKVQIGNDVKEFMVEIKPKKETIPPRKPTTNNAKAQLRYKRECLTWIVNSAKWEAMRKYCSKNGIEFMFFTEDHLNVR